MTLEAAKKRTGKKSTLINRHGSLEHVRPLRLVHGACHVYLASHDPAMTPVAKAERIRRVYKKNHDWMSKVFHSGPVPGN